MLPISSKTTSLMISLSMRQENLKINESIARLSSGLRVMAPSDDPAAYFVSKSLDRRAHSINTISNNLTETIAGLKNAMNTLTEMRDLLSKMSDLALAASSTAPADNSDRENYATEYETYRQQVADLASTNDYNGSNYLAGFSRPLQTDEGSGVTYTAEITTTVYDDANGLNLGVADAVVDWSDIGTLPADNATEIANAGNYYTAINADDQGLARIDRSIGEISTSLAILEGRQSSLLNKAANYAAASSALVGVDQALETTNIATSQLQKQANAFFLAQANSSNASVMQLLFGFGQ